MELFGEVCVCVLQDESSVAALMEACITDDDKLYLCVSSPTIRDKPVQIRPWRLADADFVLDASMPLDPRKTVFVGGVPRPLKAGEWFVKNLSSPIAVHTLKCLMCPACFPL